ncbi:MAG: cell division protein ZipA C-terminal FtsZ-binding domain-containing protein [Pseudomonadota bacterium]
MESAELRILILALGILFVAAIYLWERHKSTHAQHNRRRKIQNMIEADAKEAGDGRIEPRVAISKFQNYFSSSSDGGQKDDAAETPDTIEEETQEVGIEPSPQREEILILSVASRRKFFTGDAIVSAMLAADLQSGPMDVYYRYNDDHSDTLFTVASMVNPGTFPQDMSRFRSSGLALFARLPGCRDGSDIFEAMYGAAQLLAETLDGRVLGGDHEPLTEETLAQMRSVAAGMPAQRIKAAAG